MQVLTLPLAAAGEAAIEALDERAEWETFSRPVAARAGEWESWLAIEGMYCPGCSLVIERALAGLPGVRAVEVNGATATARIAWAPGQGRPSQWLRAVKAAGYAAVPAGDQLA